jgi:hypothetical protein
MIVTQAETSNTVIRIFPAWREGLDESLADLGQGTVRVGQDFVHAIETVEFLGTLLE